jgi:polyhydroxybutyrate depolymerase
MLGHKKFFWLEADTVRSALFVFAALGLCACAPPPCAGKVGLCTGTETISIDGRERSYRVHLPPSYDGVTPLPVVLVLHGRLGTPEKTEEIAHFDEVSDAAGFISVFPEGVRKSWNDPRGVTPASRKNIDDEGFLLALLDDLPNRFVIDPARIYAMGMSNGGFMTTQLGCIAADKLAAISTLVASFSENSLATCQPARALPVQIVMGDQDPLVPYEGGPTRNNGEGVAVSAEDSRAAWALKNGCEETPSATFLPDADPNDGTITLQEAHTQCQSNAQVVLLTVQGGGHTWPGGEQYLSVRSIGKTSRDFDYGEVALEFFSQFTLP